MGTLQSNRSKARFLPSPFSLLPLALLFVLCLSCENPASDNDGGENNDMDFVAVAGISGLPQSVSVGTEIDLGSAVVTPQNATNSEIVWSVKEDDTTGVTDADLAGGAFTPLSAGTLTLTATVADGSGADADFTRDFTIIITLWREVEGYAGGGGHVVFGAGKFISCSYIDGSAAYSADGEHWTAITKVATTFGDDYIKNLAFIENTFWAVGKGGKIAKSSNGADWTAVNHGVATTATFYGIAYSGTKYIIAGEGATDNAPGRMIASGDGVTWTDITPASNPFTAKIDSIAYGEGKFLAVGNGGKAAISQDDGETWTDVTAPMFSGNHIKMAAFGGGKFVAVSRYGLGTTTDGADWAWSELWSFTQNPASQDVKVWIQAVIWDGASFYIGAQGGRVAYSATGAPESWHYAVDGTNKDTAGVFHNMNDYINGIACGAIDGKKIYVATGGDGAPKAAIAISNEE